MSASAGSPSRLRLWVEGARPRTLTAALSPVLVGTAVAAREGTVVPWRAGAALVVALALQVGVNYANDYSDGVRGVDQRRQGPVRLTASGAAAPAAVRRAALLAFAVAALAGLALALVVDRRLLLVGAAAIVAAALYSGGPRPYASAGLGEVSVLVFFGVVATCGSAYVHLRRVPVLALGGSVPVGLLSCAILLANNLRDVESDRLAGKRTLAVRLGAVRGRRLYTGCVVVALAAVAAIGLAVPLALIALVAAPLAFRPLRTVAAVPGVEPRALVGALVGTARLQLVVSALLAVALCLS